MELKFFDSMSTVEVQKGILCSTSVINNKNIVSLRFSQNFSSYRGALLNSAYSKTLQCTARQDRSVSTVIQGKRLTDSSLYHINGTNDTNSRLYSRDPRMLDAYDDEYGGVVVNPDKLPARPDIFISMLRFSLLQWKMQGKKGIWLKLPLEISEFVPIAVKEGFLYHHAERRYVMLTYWLPEGPCMLPANASHQVGVGGFVMNDKNEILVVQERYCSPAFASLWKLPTGFIHESEEIFDGAVREVKEETGIDTEFIKVIAFRHAHNIAFEKSDLFFICMLRPLSTRIAVDDHEIQAAKWMPLAEFVNQPSIQGDGMFKKIIDICLAWLGRRYCGLFPHEVVSKFDGRESTLYYNFLQDEDSNCETNTG